MFNKERIIFLKALSPIQVGDSQSVSGVSSRVQRDIYNVPIINATVIKGSLRDGNCTLFGKDLNNKNKKYNTLSYGKLGFMDARTLFFPVQTSEDIFEYITSPQVVIEYLQELSNRRDTVEEKVLIKEARDILATMRELILSKRLICINGIINNQIEINGAYYDPIIRFEVVKKLVRLFPRELLRKKIYMLNDDDFIENVNNCIEERIRIKLTNNINENMFYEENIPENTVFYTIIMETNLVDYFKGYELPKKLILGGRTTLGKGKLRIIEEGEN